MFYVIVDPVVGSWGPGLPTFEFVLRKIFLITFWSAAGRVVTPFTTLVFNGPSLFKYTPGSAPGHVVKTYFFSGHLPALSPPKILLNLGSQHWTHYTHPQGYWTQHVTGVTIRCYLRGGFSWWLPSSLSSSSSSRWEFSSSRSRSVLSDMEDISVSTVLSASELSIDSKKTTVWHRAGERVKVVSIEHYRTVLKCVPSRGRESGRRGKSLKTGVWNKSIPLPTILGLLQNTASSHCHLGNWDQGDRDPAMVHTLQDKSN